MTDETPITIPSLDDLYQTYTREELVKEASRFATVPTGWYRLKVDSYELRPMQEDLDKIPEHPEWDDYIKERMKRHRGHLTVIVSKDGNVMGRVFPDISWVERRGSTGRLDGQSQLWGQWIKALGMQESSAAEVLDAIKSYEVEGYVAELFRFGEGRDAEYKTAKTAEQRKQYSEDGGEPQNVLRSVREPKAED